MSRLLCALWLALALMVSATALTPIGAIADELLAIGDSVLAYYKEDGASAPDAVSAALGQRVVNKAQSGATIDGGLLRAITGFKIPEQYSQGNWDWVVLNGGANDLRNRCDCDHCEVMLNYLLAPDATTGLIYDLVARIRADGVRVALMGYYDGPSGLPTSFTACIDELNVLDERLAKLAQSDAGIVFADSGDVIDPDNRADYNDDLIHPSRKGAQKIGALLAATMQGAGG